MNDIERLVAIEEIKQLKAKYFLGVDTKDWDLLRREVFCEQSRFDLPETGDASFVGSEAIVAFFIECLSNCVTAHSGHSPIIEITSDTTATGVWGMEDYIWGRPMGDIAWLHGFGHYHENYIKLGNGWRFTQFTLKRLRVETGSFA